MSKTFSQIMQEAREHPLYNDFKTRAYLEYTIRKTTPEHPEDLQDTVNAALRNLKSALNYGGKGI